MKRNNFWVDLIYSLFFLLLLLTAPLAGAFLAGHAPAAYLEFPPTTEEVDQPKFTWSAFVLILIFVVITTWPFWKRLINGKWKPIKGHGSQKLPWWGKLAATGLIFFWILAWNRFPWMEFFQSYTFFPLWFCFVILLNAIAHKRTGRSIMISRPVYFSMLFPVSAAFWWVFEYLNRFVNNWYYVRVNELESWQYFLEASLAFSTVLPAVLSMTYLILQIPVFRDEYDNFPTMKWLKSEMLWIGLGLMSVLSLAGIGWASKFTYTLLWIVPGLLWISFQQIKGFTNPILKKAAQGDLTLVWSSAMAALLCGFFWEMWNFYSEAKWLYNVPGVERFYLFEMPVLGYAGYLPFGVICLLICYSLFVTLRREEWIMEDDLF